ncbi:MAG: DMT family transporter [Paracoccaceae bacterium]|jgi:drug/metabolite transporter (DMT)-like permease|nr:DMT family transporter [Paracoccaceae bacterium]
MRLFLLTALTMLAFAANSILNRMALEDGATGPAAFAAIRLVSGALCLWALVAWRSSGRGGGWRPMWQPGGAASLALYVLGFSFAYVSLQAGVGALILFGGVQITMFAGALILREAVPARRWAGAALAFGGLVWLLWPADGGAAPDPVGAALMAAAALGWGIYSLLGRGATNPLRATAGNFVFAAPLGLLVLAVLPDSASAQGVILAVILGAVTSGCGYALWYAVLPRLGAARAAVAQLCVPVIAAAGGLLLLGEGISLRFAMASALVLGGVLLASLPPSRKAQVLGKDA